jgi:hypothetical protein
MTQTAFNEAFSRIISDQRNRMASNDDPSECEQNILDFLECNLVEINAIYCREKNKGRDFFEEVKIRRVILQNSDESGRTKLEDIISELESQGERIEKITEKKQHLLSQGLAIEFNDGSIKLIS